MMSRWPAHGCRSASNSSPDGARTTGPVPDASFSPPDPTPFAALADAINAGFARWDLAHLSEFILSDGTRIADPDPDFDEHEGTLDIRTTKLSTLKLSDQFAYTFDFGDDWQHLCTVDPERVDPEQQCGITRAAPVAYWGWGAVPDQYGRRFADDDGDGPVPPDPEGRDLPAFFASWRWSAAFR